MGLIDMACGNNHLVHYCAVSLLVIVLIIR